MMCLSRPLRVAADVATARATRRAATLPMIARMAGTALAAEAELQATELDRVLTSAGLPTSNLLHRLARSIPSTLTRVAETVVVIERRVAGTLNRLAGDGVPRTASPDPTSSTDGHTAEHADEHAAEKQ